MTDDQPTDPESFQDLAKAVGLITHYPDDYPLDEGIALDKQARLSVRGVRAWVVAAKTVLREGRALRLRHLALKGALRRMVELPPHVDAYTTADRLRIYTEQARELLRAEDGQ